MSEASVARTVLFVLMAGAGCAATPAPEAAPAPATEPPPEERLEAVVVPVDHSEEEAAIRSLPEGCENPEAPVCTPPADFVARLCRNPQPDVALALFKKGTPFSRAWLRGPVEAWYASGARSRPMQLRYAEEVLVLADRGTPNGKVVQVSGSGSFDVLRWDGSCVSLMSGELSLRPLGAPEVAEIPWRHLDEDIKSALVSDKAIASRNDKRLEVCKGGDERRCEEARLGLSRMIADYVRRGGDLPAPKLLP